MLDKKQNFKKVLKIFGILVVLDLLYLNVLVPITISAEQLFLIALAVVNVCEKRSVSISSLTPNELDEIIKLSIDSVKQVFKENGFKFIPSLPAYVSGNEIVIRVINFFDYLLQLFSKKS